ncbi:MAG: type II secretion system F family protein [Planctomycetes bacterium]|nr:type II secretion system F family protein [Planctomycetota bacterium]
MTTYKYTAKNMEGSTVKGSMDAQSEGEVVGELRKKNLIIMGIQEDSARKNKGGGISLKAGAKPGKPRKDDIVIFTRQLATMISAGITLLDALEILVSQMENPGFKKTLSNVAEDIRTGNDLSRALSKHPKSFSDIYVNMIKAGEVSGQLDEILVRLAEYLEDAAKLKREIKAAMTYPCVSLFLIIGITMFLMVGVVPSFKPVFESLEIELPGVTKGVLQASELIKGNFLLTLGAMAGLIVAFVLFKKSKRGSRLFDWFLLKVPIFGPLFRKVALSRFSRTFSTLIRSGVPILGSLEIVAATSGNIIISDAVLQAKESVKNGNTLSDPLAKSWVFPPMVTRMISIGEKSGALEGLLEKISVFYDEQVSAQVKSLTSMIEPLMIAVMGFLVGGIVLAVFLPIFKIQEKLSNHG